MNIPFELFIGLIGGILWVMSMLSLPSGETTVTIYEEVQDDGAL